MFEYVKGRAAAVIKIVGYVLICGFLVFLLQGAIIMTETAGITLSPVLHIPLSVIYFCLIIGPVLTILNYVWMIIKNLLFIVGKEEKVC